MFVLNFEFRWFRVAAIFARRYSLFHFGAAACIQTRNFSNISTWLTKAKQTLHRYTLSCGQRSYFLAPLLLRTVSVAWFCCWYALNWILTENAKLNEATKLKHTKTYIVLVWQPVRLNWINSGKNTKCAILVTHLFFMYKSSFSAIYSFGTSELHNIYH